MDAYEATRIVFSRIQSLDPDNAAKIMGLLLLQDHGEKEMIRLAFGPEALIHSLILKARKDLGAAPAPPSAPASPSTPLAASPFLLTRQNSAGGRLVPPSPLAVASPSWAPPPPFARSNSASKNFSASDEVQSPDELVSPNDCENVYFGAEFGDEPFVNEQKGDFFYGDGDGVFNYGWALNAGQRRSCSANGSAEIGDDAAVGGFGWKPCMYFARGYCKNGSACRFIHGLIDENSAKMDAAVEQQCQELLMRSKSPRTSQLMASAFPYSPTGSPSASAKCLNFLLQQQQQNENHRAAAAAAAAALMLGGDESHKFMARSRLDRSDMNPGSRQIYLTFPADSTFREEDVSNYFSIYGPVQDVRIPYQQKRMFGFVTFVYPETVKLILAKGNPHFVCDARVLVKPYKEKGKVPDKFRKQQQQQADGLGLDSRGDPYDFQQFGPRMLYNSSSGQELLLRRKLEEQQQAAELQKAIELQNRRFMGLQLLDLKHRSLSSAPAFINATAVNNTTPNLSTDNNSNNSGNEVSSPEEKSPSGGSEQKMNSCHGFLHQTAVNPCDKEESTNVDANPKIDSEFQESGEHNLPDSPFASPTKASNAVHPFSAAEVDIATSKASATPYNNNNNNNHLIPPTFLPPSPTLNMAPFKSCFFQMPRFSSNHGAIGM